MLAIKISPCTRGKLTAASDSTGGHWFTPVYTGQTLPPQNEWLFHRCIPVHTGQIFHPKIQALCSEIHPRTHGADIRGTALSQEMADSSPYARGRLTYCLIFVYHFRFIPVRTGQILKSPRKSLLPPHSSMTESVCVIFSECIFADNTFWSFSMFFPKKRCQRHLFCSVSIS